ncbi:hypothetical protein LJC34_03690 [Oscillospiraceae bacterium OttesenSCG-928-G22]|nr:hypothetical protein [Oscillospiraceae bacterium OttesenSCG-928-G22]
MERANAKLIKLGLQLSQTGRKKEAIRKKLERIYNAYGLDHPLVINLVEEWTAVDNKFQDLERQYNYYEFISKSAPWRKIG